ncbi:hypothetical protein LCGC14_0318050 [marine sediment metagenome]|uniref:HTH cro/C1-type domain-containing protein n=1 Tax=marine sediment metagenome TaxID=412755 RepID=A0A0F9W797_9ZZZZ
MKGTSVKSELRDIGVRLRKLRENKGMSVNELSEKMGISGGVIVNLEKNKSKRLHDRTHKKLLKLLGGNGSSAPRKPVRRQARSPEPVELPNMREVEEALGLDTGSSTTPPLKLSFGRMSITIEVD